MLPSGIDPNIKLLYPKGLEAQPKP